MACISNIPQNANPSWGYYGTIGHYGEPEDAWPRAMNFIADTTGCADDEVRAFLDSRYGRHFADDVANELSAGKIIADAIAAATARWMGWRISIRTARDTGIPRGLPYLTGFVMHAAIEAEIAD